MYNIIHPLIIHTLVFSPAKTSSLWCGQGYRNYVIFLPRASHLFNYCVLQSVSSYFIDDMANSLFQQPLGR